MQIPGGPYNTVLGCLYCDRSDRSKEVQSGSEETGKELRREARTPGVCPDIP